MYWRRVARSAGPHIFVWGILIGGFWAIIHFGPFAPCMMVYMFDGHDF